LNTIHSSVTLKNSIIIEPCFIGENVRLVNSVVGPFASIGDDCEIVYSVVNNSIVQHEVTLKNMVMRDSMIGSKSKLNGLAQDLSLGDYSFMNE